VLSFVVVLSLAPFNIV
jgi:hypothetical protein